MQILILARISFREFMRRRVVYGLFVIAVAFIVLGRGCSSATLDFEGVAFEHAVASMQAAAAFHLIAFFSVFLCALVASAALTRELDEGTALLTLSRPLSRARFAAGKLLGVMYLCALNLGVLGAILCTLQYERAGVACLKVFPALALVLFSLLLFALMCMFLSLVMGRLIAPVLAMLVYALSCWYALPFHFSTVRMMRTPSESAERLYFLFPQFGDVQLFAVALLGPQPEFSALLRPLAFVLLYCICFWTATVYALSRRQL